MKHIIFFIFLSMQVWTTPVMAVSTIHPFQIQKLTQLIESHQDQVAYQYAKSIQDEFAGDLNYDKLFGEIALRTGHADEASFAFERVLVKEPNNFHISLELERAYIQLGYDPKAPLGLVKSAYIGLSGGYDSNVNLSPSNQTFTMPVFDTPLFLPTDSKQQGSFFNTLLLGGSIKKINDNNYSVFAHGDGYFRKNYRNIANYQVVRAEAGFSKGIGAYEFSVPIRGEEYIYSGNLYRRSGAVAFEVSNIINQDRIVTGLIEYRLFTYPQFSKKSLDLLVFAGKWQEYVPRIYSEIDARAYYADGNATHTGAQFLAKSFYGIQLVSTFKKYKRVMPFLAIDLQNANYNKKDITFLKARHDTYFNGSLGVIIPVLKDAFIQPDINFTNNHSNVSMQSFKEYLIEATLMYNIA